MTNDFAAALAGLEHLRETVNELRESAAQPERIPALADRLDRAIAEVGGRVNGAANDYRQLTQRLNEISAVVVSSNIRHF